MKTYLILLSSLVFTWYACPAIAQTDSVGKKYYAYAHFYANDIDQNTEYISSIFCWVYNPPKNASPDYPSDYLTKWAKAQFKDQLPKEKIKDCTCRFQVDTVAQFYNAAQALHNWSQESTDCNTQGISVIIVTFPVCITENK